MPRRVVMLACVVLSTSSLFAADASRWDQLLAELAASEFGVRESAAAALIEAGEPAFDAVANAANRPGEAGLRAAKILEAWAFDAEGPLAERAERQLMDFSDGETATLAVESRMALNAARDVRERRATEAIRSFHGEVRSAPQYSPYNGFGFGAQPAEPFRPSRVELIAVYHDWIGGLDGLWHLRRFDHQSGLTVRVCDRDLPDPEVMALASNLESATVTFVGASLGLRAESSSPLVIADVFPGTAAHTAGLQAGDQIIEFDNVAIESISDLIQLLRDYEPGDKGIVKFVRYGQTRGTEVELQGWREMPTPRNIQLQMQMQRRQFAPFPPRNQIQIPLPPQRQDNIAPPADDAPSPADPE